MADFGIARLAKQAGGVTRSGVAPELLTAKYTERAKMDFPFRVFSVVRGLNFIVPRNFHFISGSMMSSDKSA